MRARQSHTLAPLPQLTSSKVNFKLMKIKGDDFKENKQIVAHNILSAILKLIPMQ